MAESFVFVVEGVWACDKGNIISYNLNIMNVCQQPFDAKDEKTAIDGHLLVSCRTVKYQLTISSSKCE